MAFTVTQLNSLEEAISEGALEVQYQDKRVRYASLSEMKKLRDLMRSELGMTETSPGSSATNVRIRGLYDKDA